LRRFSSTVDPVLDEEDLRPLEWLLLELRAREPGWEKELDVGGDERGCGCA
jgi:hypothetical protein